MKKVVTAGLVGLTAASLVVAQAEAANRPKLSSQPANTTERVYEGEGWQALPNVESIDTATPYKINFGSQTALDVLYPYAQKVEQTLENATGLDIQLTTEIYSDGTPSCGEVPYHTITLRYKYAPTGDPGMSWGVNCYATGDHSVWGGWAYIDSIYWTQANYFGAYPGDNDSWRKNVVTHEVGHVMGLSHPNPVDSNGEDIHGVPCTDTNYVQPIMCTWPDGDHPLGGYLHPDNAGKYTPYEISGLQQLVANDSI